MTASGQWDLPVVLRSEVDALVKEETDVSAYTFVGGIFLGGAIAAAVTLTAGVVSPTPVYGALAVLIALTIAFAILAVRERIHRQQAKTKIDQTPFKFLLGWEPGTSAPGVSGPGPQTSSVKPTVPTPTPADAAASAPMPSGDDAT